MKFIVTIDNSKDDGLSPQDLAFVLQHQLCLLRYGPDTKVEPYPPNPVPTD